MIPTVVCSPREARAAPWFTWFRTAGRDTQVPGCTRRRIRIGCPRATHKGRLIGCPRATHVSAEVDAFRSLSHHSCVHKYILMSYIRRPFFQAARFSYGFLFSIRDAVLEGISPLRPGGLRLGLGDRRHAR